MIINICKIITALLLAMALITSIKPLAMQANSTLDTITQVVITKQLPDAK